ncbi:malto-oligosyltrehalose synthase [Dyella sp. M7H15-1]|uniref:malto-oligosyltrehalose synthase n=1 Tax=Dyella sp. M7H15-1 TaxID=2501295 RepID=UPI001004F75F|nr:malto-oligosyltrehalose synthase [Dyella sp. M7H15-1]QAU22789.1 malto-oligosyltrehalose synthase [Dyella sp. M7H15-1]
MTTLRATVRLQLNRDFDFAAAAAQVPYFAAMGLSHIYMSPIAMARPGSTHGYDVVDPMIVNPELGGEAGLAALADVLHANDMGAILDIVPNHMAADLANTWWGDVLTQGEASAYASYFDIEWDAPGAQRKVWLPWLDAPLERVLHNRRCMLERHTGGTGIGLWLDDSMLPASERSLQWLFERAEVALPPHAVAGRVFDAARRCMQDRQTHAALDQAIATVNADTALMSRFLELQHYCLGRWSDSGERLNYRRFFDIHTLAALRMDRDAVFEAVHALPLRLIENGTIDGLRIDHIDGLSQPGHYLRRLRERMDRSSQRDLQRHVTLHVEKILAPGETLPADWPVDGATGYDFMREVSALLHDPVGYAELRHAWATLTGGCAEFAQEERTARLYMLNTLLGAELSRCARAFQQFLASKAERDVALDVLRDALCDVLANMPVYRSYLGDGKITKADRQTLEHAFAHAKQDGAADRAPVRAMIRRCLLSIDAAQLPAEQAQRLQTVRYRFEQLSSALSAKAVEDTAFYRYGALLSHNEVGGAPAHVQPEPESFHAAMPWRASRWPRSLLATATHDHKRGEDTRARLDVLGERAQTFLETFNAFSKAVDHRMPLHPSTLWMLLQTLLAAWPLGTHADDTLVMQMFAERIKAWLLKAEREAKLHTCWTAPDHDYETACGTLVDDLFISGEFASVCHDLCHAAGKLDAAGALNGLAAATLHFTVPGVPDLYQGTEYWDLSLVDPDNRCAVDYRTRAETLEQRLDFRTLVPQYRDGVIKQHLIHGLLQLRKAWPELFANGSYQPVVVDGARQKHVVAFVRRHGSHQLFVAVPRLCARHMARADLPMADPDFWTDTRVEAFSDDHACVFVDVFTHRKHRVKPSGWRAGELFADAPVAILIPASQAHECPTLTG